MSSLFAHALKQEIGLPVARLLVLVRTPSQVFKLATGRGLKDSHTRLSDRLSGSPGVRAYLPREDLIRHSPTVCPGCIGFPFLRLTPPCWSP
jgi:ABC-type thiamine transport system ATPase subunit